MRPRHLIFGFFITLACVVWVWAFWSANPDLPTFLRHTLALLLVCLVGLIGSGLYLIVKGMWQLSERIEINVQIWIRERARYRQYRGRR